MGAPPVLELVEQRWMGTFFGRKVRIQLCSLHRDRRAVLWQIRFQRRAALAVAFAVRIHANPVPPVEENPSRVLSHGAEGNHDGFLLANVTGQPGHQRSGPRVTRLDAGRLPGRLAPSLAALKTAL
ncbi:hypothetical protein E5E91_14125 [Deinococcus radiodurans R1 = ATCC 13939 = DSM 20539]|uniref:Uncharacterized protein n=1 Tax=Deinococcus radiodurans (strain ATCC 13939 / DSM 20539 / JCM 16871 / CCUG 27074 / LMG 4051 / NBRC 15346 / NCIMB 9279 / VKM B-1422 / R1) TaxID=243230 RepID=Q9RZ66_DEIRA|nr:hypothetical protein DR_A0088 [Deinococcus radiodurans R1 = ATCC 13939 = DSM 20539]QEM72906.1 hypothetical protein DXG80_13900 [Deinococcus radiodurans]UDL01868.1 hypothetical protein E5E91_14125 [Deinococcus radiodurans R1 = ATCC 13939 = DSM 20539]